MRTHHSTFYLVLGTLCGLLLSQTSAAFVVRPHVGVKTTAVASPTAIRLGNFGGGNKKNQQEDLSDIESRDMTREEMLELNKKNEDIMNMELGAMTAFSLVLTLPILYLCWVAFFSD